MREVSTMTSVCVLVREIVSECVCKMKDRECV